MKKSASPKKTSAKKSSAKKTAARKTWALGSAPKPPSRPAGFKRNTGSPLWVPEARGNAVDAGVVPASKLQKGIAKARDQISGVLQELLDATRDGYEVTELELSASFNADGKFLGFGVGGEMSITFKVRPTNEA